MTGLVGLVLWTSATAASAELAVFGNSYSSEPMVAAIEATFAELEPGSTVARYAEGGYRLEHHLGKAQAGPNPWTDALITGDTEWDWVIRQEHGDIPGLDESDLSRVVSLDAAAGLDDLIAARAWQTVFLMTWGSVEGEPKYPEIYGDFLSMQARIEAGTQEYVTELSTDARPVYVIPAGVAFRLAYDDTVLHGDDPLDPTTRFGELYDDDGQHLSGRGDALVGYVALAALTGESPVGLVGAAEGLSEEYRDWLQEIAHDAVFEHTDYILYPWEEAEEPPEEPDPGDTGAPTDTDEPTADTGAAEPPADKTPVSSTCASTPRPRPRAPWALVGALWWLVLRGRAPRG